MGEFDFREATELALRTFDFGDGELELAIRVSKHDSIWNPNTCAREPTPNQSEFYYVRVRSERGYRDVRIGRVVDVSGQDWTPLRREAQADLVTNVITVLTYLIDRGATGSVKTDETRALLQSPIDGCDLNAARVRLFERITSLLVEGEIGQRGYPAVSCYTPDLNPS